MLRFEDSVTEFSGRALRRRSRTSLIALKKAGGIVRFRLVHRSRALRYLLG